MQRGGGGGGGGGGEKRKKEQRKIKRKRQRLDTRMVLSVTSDCLVCNFVRARPKYKLEKTSHKSAIQAAKTPTNSVFHAEL